MNFPVKITILQHFLPHPIMITKRPPKPPSDGKNHLWWEWYKSHFFSVGELWKNVFLDHGAKSPLLTDPHMCNLSFQYYYILPFLPFNSCITITKHSLAFTFHVSVYILQCLQFAFTRTFLHVCLHFMSTQNVNVCILRRLHFAAQQHVPLI